MTEVVDIGFVPAPRGGKTAEKLQVDGGGAVAASDSFGFAVPAVRAANPARPGGGKICARPACARQVPAQTGPGARRRYCSATCQKRGRSGTSAPQVVAPRRPVGEFGRRLRAAIDDSGLKLATISRRLTEEDGVVVQPSTLSNWQNGSLPRRSLEEKQRIFALERVLGLRRSELFLLLSKERKAVVTPLVRPRPHDDIESFKADLDRRGGVNGYVTTGIRDTVVVGVNRRENVRTVRQTIRAIESNRVDCYWAFYSTDTVTSLADVKVHSGCRVGRIVIEGGMLGVELLFDQVVPLGGSHTFEFSIYPHGAPEPCVRRATGSPALETLDMTVRFEVRPATVWLAEWPTRTGESHRREADLVDGSVRLSSRDPVPGYVGVEWAW